MAYDEGLATRVWEQLNDLPGATEKRMFGGVAYMLQGNMAAGVIGDDLIVRVGKEAYEELLAQPHARIFDFTGRPMKNWLMVAPQGCAEDEDLKTWLQRGIDFALSLPPK